MITPRRRARQFVVQALYQAQLNKEESANAIAANMRSNDLFAKADDALFTQIFFGAFNNQREYMQHIRPLLDRHEDELSPVERAVLLMAYFELAQMPETPYPVIINEAIEITKTYGGTDGYKFVNGILDKLASQLRPNDPKHAAQA
ncbi:transcription antitermination factor NusB [Snodgrassella sp. CFCC 13594]|uniref:transcription antitermination factor NusB n=1 Tax=Snodgrassella sp. CFCC 13594 TaxID=1775559 RepID=UPI0008311353|nr:transcription antitermination factor NusB [Snodgrassella sp. CFCC 13594]